MAACVQVRASHLPIWMSSLMLKCPPSLPFRRMTTSSPIAADIRFVWFEFANVHHRYPTPTPLVTTNQP